MFDPFPDPRQATTEGILCIGGNLNVETLLAAYRKGIFPWPQEGYPLIWFSPDPRGVLDFQDFHIPRSLAKWSRSSSSRFRFSRNQAFDEVIRGCREQPRTNQTGTWITEEMVNGYQVLFDSGYVETVECWEGDELVAGIYGVRTERYFSAESMFHRRTNTSKMCLWRLVDSLREEGLTWMDVQMVTDVTSSFGARLISRECFLARIGQSE